MEVSILRGEIKPSPKLRSRGASSSVGLGDYFDATYTVLADVGDTTLPLVLDTGSADLWVLSQQSLTEAIPVYAGVSFYSAGLDAAFLYGDSRTGTAAYGPIGRDVFSLAGLPNPNQYFASVGKTNTSVERTGAAGIFGLGFPLNSVIWNELLSAQYPRARRRSKQLDLTTKTFPDLSFISASRLAPVSGTKAPLRRAIPTVEDVLDSFTSYGPPTARLALGSALTAPMFCIALQREVVDIGGNAGALTLGGLPTGVDAQALKWANVRTYATDEGGLGAPMTSPDEKYPLAWEVPVDDVYLDGQRLPRSNLSSANIALTALIDTGSSLVRGPADVLALIYSRIGGEDYPCKAAHTLAFSIAGQLFPIDPRDFGSQSYDDSPATCTPALAPADPPGGGFLYSWSLGDPFLKGALTAYYYGNLTYPSQDPPRIGFLSTVPPDAGDRLTQVVENAMAAGGLLASTAEPAPTGYVLGPTNSLGVPQAVPSGSISVGNPASPRMTVDPLLMLIATCIGILLLQR
ncbi:acid protease [Peniophora sp. CONT]|nr:acid protease [Peniophora sp. CONT]